MKDGVRKPNALIYGVAGAILRKKYIRDFGLNIDASGIEGIKGPFIAVANHASNLDYITVGVSLLPHRMNYVTSSIFFKPTLQRKLLSMMGAIEKHQFTNDIPCAKKCLAVLRRGDNLLIFPSAQVGYAGVNAYVDDSTARLAKKSGVQLVAVRTDGAYLSLPKWSKQKSYGRMDVHATVLLSAEQVKEMSVEEIQRRITDALDFNDYKWQKTAKTEFLPVRTPVGLENVLHRCPKCGTDYSMRTDDEKLYCEKCGYSVIQNNYGFFEGENVVFDNITDWHAEIHRHLKKQIDAGDFKLCLPVTLMTTIMGKGWYHDCGVGTATLDKNGLVYVGTDGDKTVEYVFPLTCQTAITHTAGLGFDFHKGFDRTLCLAPEDKRYVVTVVEAYSLLREKYIDK